MRLLAQSKGLALQKRIFEILIPFSTSRVENERPKLKKQRQEHNFQGYLFYAINQSQSINTYLYSPQVATEVDDLKGIRLSSAQGWPNKPRLLKAGTWVIEALVQSSAVGFFIPGAYFPCFIQGTSKRFRVGF
jgi:hypothetical protein